MMYLYRVIKPDTVYFSDNVYTVDFSLPKPVKNPDVYDDDGSGGDPGSNAESRAYADPVDLPADETVSEEDVWNRLKEMLELERQLIISQAYKEAAGIQTQAYNEGLRKATEEKTAEISQAISRVESAVADIRNLVKSRLDEYEQILVDISAEIASKVLHRKIEQDDSVLTELVRTAVSEVRNSEWISVTLSDKLKMSLQELERTIRPAVMDGKLEVVTKNVPPGTCVVETPDGIVDASIETQINNLKNLLEQIRTA